MFKLVVVFAVAICAADAGIIAGGLGHGAVLAAPIAIHSHHVAESYQNNNQISLHPTPIVVAHAAPVVHKVAVAAPVAVLSHGLHLGGLH